jgi:hypothetical protein
MSYRRVNGRGRYGNEAVALKGERRTDKEGRAISPRDL